MERPNDLTNFKGFTSVIDPKRNLFVDTLSQAFIFLITAAAVLPRLFLRRNIGERVFSPFMFFLSFLFFLFIGYMLFESSNESFFERRLNFSLEGVTGVEYWKNILLYLFLLLINPLTLFLLLYFYKGINHFIRVYFRREPNKIKYSIYRGEGIYFEHKKGGKLFGRFEIDDTVIRTFYEPIAAIIWGLSLAVLCFLILKLRSNFLTTDNTFVQFLDFTIIGIYVSALIFMISAVFLLIEEINYKLKYRNRALDLIDGEIDMQIILAIKDKIIKNSSGTESSKQHEATDINTPIID